MHIVFLVVFGPTMRNIRQNSRKTPSTGTTINFNKTYHFSHMVRRRL